MQNIKTAWNQARSEYQNTRQRRRPRPRPVHFDDVRLTNNTMNTKRKKAMSSKGQPEVAKYTTTTKDTKKESSSATDSTFRSADLDLITNPTILNESFLRDIQTSKPDDLDTTNGLIVDTQLDANDLPRQIVTAKTPEGRPLVRDNFAASRKRSAASIESTPELSEEYVLRVQRRVEQLERELELARARLSLYENDRLTISQANPNQNTESTTQEARYTSYGDDRSRALQEGDYHEYATSNAPSIQRQLESPEVEEAGAAIATILNTSPSARRKQEESEDPFYLSPGKLVLSPVQVHVADVSNGEIARKQAVQALKRRIKRRAE